MPRGRKKAVEEATENVVSTESLDAEVAADAAVDEAAEAGTQAAAAEDAPAAPKRRGRRKAADTAGAETKKGTPGRKPGVKKDVVRTAYVERSDGTQFSVDEIMEQVEADFKANNKRRGYSDIRVYIKPKESKAYYVVQPTRGEEITGAIDI